MFCKKLYRVDPAALLGSGVRWGATLFTGWAQVRYQYGASVDDAAEKLQYDLYYELLAKRRIEEWCAATRAVFTPFLTVASVIRPLN